ncbi:glycerophosphodiester phosphodiesterase [Bacillus carboniphilus]|uniref:Glycerophosphodiester phosphodiesterase n=1 Tax=Bacillus carboniphilus TaxID=86663 RepID=A0ABP3FP11_9BACI
MEETLIYAHRGSKGTHPENTLIAFEHAIHLGVDGIELDVHLSKDGHLIVIHDETVDRTTNGTGYIRDLTLTEIKRLDAGSWFSTEYEGEQVPTLSEVLELMKNTTLYLNIEIKADIIPYENIEEKILQAIRDSDFDEKRIIISSFNHYSVAKFKKLAPNIETAILFMEILLDPWEYAKTVGATSLHVYEPVAFTETAHEALKNNFPVRTFTVNNKNHMRALMEQNISAIMTDYPKEALTIRSELKKKETGT